MSEYLSPYITCSHCNVISFIDASRIKGQTPSTSYETLPPCFSCGKTLALKAGIHHTTKEDEEEEHERRYIDSMDEDEQQRELEEACVLIQKRVRGVLAKKLVERKRMDKREFDAQQKRAASSIQKRVRGGAARREVLIHRCLHVIQTCHPSLLENAIINTGRRTRVFWYEDEQELAVFFWDYREFVRRTGHRPPLVTVEKNVIEITRRIIEKEHELVTRVQSRWRGLTVRATIVILRREKAKFRAVKNAAAAVVQRFFRAHLGRRTAFLRKSTNPNNQLLHEYQEYRKIALLDSNQSRSRRRIQSKYLEMHRQKRTARLVGVLDTTKDGGKTTVQFLKRSLRGSQILRDNLKHIENTKAFTDALTLTNPSRNNTLSPIESRVPRRLKDLRKFPQPVRKHRAPFSMVFHIPEKDSRRSVIDDDERDRS